MTKKSFPKRVVVDDKYFSLIKKAIAKSPDYRDPKQFVELAIIDRLAKDGISSKK